VSFQFDFAKLVVPKCQTILGSDEQMVAVELDRKGPTSAMSTPRSSSFDRDVMD